MFEIIYAGGWLMLPILLMSIAAMAIILERLFALQERRVIPSGLIEKVLKWADHKELDAVHLEDAGFKSAMGQIVSVGIRNAGQSRDTVKEAIEDTGRHVIHELERYLNTLGTIATVTPLLGLLGTVIGMIKVFNAIVAHGVGDPTVLASGISEALITTAAGMSVAIPSLIFYRYFRGRIERLVVQMEKQTIHLVDVLERKRIQDEEDAAGQLKETLLAEGEAAQEEAQA